MSARSSEFLELKGLDWQAFEPSIRARLVERAFGYWRRAGFPHYSLTHAEILREYENLAAQAVSPISKSGIGGSTTGLRLANFFQPQMWSVRVSRYLSPHDVFIDDGLLRAAIRRSWSIWPDRFGANPATLRRILKTFPGTASVSNFRPTVARSVFGYFSEEGSTVVDFSAGYGGRLLGSLPLKRHYIGIEPCRAQKKGLMMMLQALRGAHTLGSAEILHGCAEDLMPGLPRSCADLVFSSPPYFNWERYSNDPSQSFIRHATYEAWKEGFLRPVLNESARVLRKGGCLVLNISGRGRRPQTPEVKIMCRAAGLRFVGSIPMLISKVPYMHPRNNRPHKLEILLVFAKR